MSRLKYLYKGNNFVATSRLPTQQEVTKVLAPIMYAWAEQIMTDSKANYCPVGIYPRGNRVGGNLRNTGTVHPPETNGDKVIVKLSYGGPGGSVAPYAMYVHEAPPDWGQGKHKYLEIPMRKAHRSAWLDISTAFQRALSGQA